MKSDESKNPGRVDKLSVLLVAVCCVLPVAIVFLIGLVARWVESWGSSAVMWWLALGALGAVVAAVCLRQLWKRRI